MHKLYAILVVVCISRTSIAQGPEIYVSNTGGHNVISFSNINRSATAVNIQRSSDSTKNFVTIGRVNSNDSIFADDTPSAAKVFYRLFITFAGGRYLFTPSYSSRQINIQAPFIKQVSDPVISKQPKDQAAVFKTAPTDNVKKLKEVKVQTKLKYVEQDIDKLIYHVDADPESKSMNALDMMRKIPLIMIDGDDNIEINGSTNFLVLINGKRSSLFVRSPKDVFKSMPASSIKNIEIITSPSSRYEAEGVGGIINVITIKKMVNGYNGSANVMVGSPKGFAGAANVTAKTKRFGFSVYLGNTNSLNRTNSNFLRENFIQKNTLDHSGESKTNSSSQYFGTELSYELDSLNLITANYGFNASKGNNEFSQQVKLLNAAGNASEEYRYLNDGENKWSGNDLGLDYQHNFKKDDEQLLTLSYQLSNNLNTNTAYYSQQKITNLYPQANYSDNKDLYTEHTAQADYLYSVNQQIIELGVKSIFRINTSNFFYKEQLQGSSQYILDSSRSDNFDYRQSIYAGYGSLTLKRRSAAIKIGLRIEETEVVARFRSTRSIATQSYFNLIPNITLSNKLKGTGILKLSFTQRIERPGIYYLNPYVDLTDPKNISYGNPKIRPALNNMVHFGYNTFISGSSVNVSAFHTFANNSIQKFTTLGADSIARTTFDNIGKYQATGVSLGGMTTLFKSLSVNFSNTTTYIKYTGRINGRNQVNTGFVFNIFGYGSYRFQKGWRASGSVGYSSANIMLQGKTSGYTWNTLSVQKDILQDNHASISLSITSPFKKYRRFFTEVNDPEFHLLQQSYFTVRRFSLSYNYRFGKLQDDIMRKKRGIKNDDLKTGEQTQRN